MSNSLLYFEPQEAILTKQDFTRELLLFKEREQNDLFILKEGMEPLIELNGKKYYCFLEQPRTIQSSNPIVMALTFIPQTFGAKFVYLRFVDEQ